MAEEKKKKTFRERLDDPVFKGLGGFNFFEMPTSPGEMYRRIEENIKQQHKTELEQTENAIKTTQTNDEVKAVQEDADLLNLELKKELKELR